MNDLELLEKHAINAALAIRWKEAINLNKKILKADRNNLGALLRLGFIYIQTSDFKEARKYYRAVLRTQPGNPIAAENIERIKILESGRKKKRSKKEFNFDPNLFLDVPGRTKSIALVNPGQKNVLAHLTIGEKVYLKPKKRKVEIRTRDNEFIGYLPDDLSKRLTLFIKAGSDYSSYIKEVTMSRVMIFIKEDAKGRRVAKFTSFPKNIGAGISAMAAGRTTVGDEENETDEEEILESDLERLAEALTHEEKEFISPFIAGEEEDEENLEE